ncbi:NADPH-dependent FMN reductase [Hellea balneolensis]|uniref:NADPH-dependent FMN reductase n=1 Tax=Hellea balneolensis TaxID=287478 RepID=UPI000429C11D|nr:NADPH-dependent FMN reductase [Hellea balneolensis]
MTAPKIAFICASLREGSINKKLEKALMKRFKISGAKTSSIDLGKYEMPLFHGDLETPKTVKKLITRLKGFDGIVVISPEYNGCLPPLLKNTIDWTSTVSTDYIKSAVWGLASCSPGPMSGIMCMRQMQFIFTRLGGDVLPQQVGCGNASKAFNERGDLVAQPASTFADNMRDMMLERISQKG